MKESFIKNTYKFIPIILFFIPLLLVGCNSDDPASQTGVSDNTQDVTSLTTEGLDEIETSHLIFMREEEKLARDVYLRLAQLYPDQTIFNRIATRAEQTHTDTMRDKLDQFNVTDPNPDTNDLPASLGVFTGNEWGWYFQEKFLLLTSQAEISELDALYVGALIEELDMHDIAVCPQIMVDRGFSSPCGLTYTDEEALRTAYSSLISGSESHLRAYVGKIEAVIGIGNYVAQYLSQDEVDIILGR
ncbi:MAG: hypothetical protein DIZ80_09335 [endosymbiont of Galathealinum brachiosum]|uniref:DUF2202 domain-containing protein n=1 Tax=endosymbiont of Galathealinum brachiosum TaxID=2200906 RepID=A0A370DC47_9GAMM|nr:MAG: hypothetical protein DIZ80_09335 [endosymbiont of Galathealinum brachiosum]